MQKSKVDLISRMNALRKLQKEVGMKIQGDTSSNTNNPRKGPMSRSGSGSGDQNRITSSGLKIGQPMGDLKDAENEKLWRHERLQFYDDERVKSVYGSPTLLQRAPVLHSNLQSYISSRRMVPNASKSPSKSAHTSIPSTHTESRRIINQRRSKDRKREEMTKSVQLYYDDYNLGHLSFSEIAGTFHVIPILLCSILLSHFFFSILSLVLS